MVEALYAMNRVRHMSRSQTIPFTNASMNALY